MFCSASCNKFKKLTIEYYKATCEKYLRGSRDLVSKLLCLQISVRLITVQIDFVRYTLFNSNNVLLRRKRGLDDEKK